MSLNPFVPCCHGHYTCLICKDKTISVIIGGSTVVGGVVVGTSISLLSYIVGVLDWELFFGACGFGALAGSMFGLMVCCSVPGLIKIDESTIKSLAEQSERERAGLRQESLSRYYQKLSDFNSGKTRDFPYRPPFY